MTSITAIFSIWMEPSLIVLSGFTMPLPIPLKSWGCLALMPKLFVVLWDHLSKVVLRPACPKTKFLKPCRYIVLTIRQKASMKLNSFLRL